MPEETEMLHTCPDCGALMDAWEFEYREICVACKHYDNTGSWSVEQALELGDFKPLALHDVLAELEATEEGG